MAMQIKLVVVVVDPMGWAEYFSEKFFIGTDCNMVIVSERENPFYLGGDGASLSPLFSNTWGHKPYFAYFWLRDEWRACSASHFKLKEWELSDALERHILRKRKGEIYL